MPAVSFDSAFAVQNPFDGLLHPATFVAQKRIEELNDGQNIRFLRLLVVF